MNRLDTLEAQSIYILREAYAKFNQLGLLWSLGKDSNVMVWLAKKAFFGLPNNDLHSSTYVSLLGVTRDKEALEDAFELLTAKNKNIKVKEIGKPTNIANNITPTKIKPNNAGSINSAIT